MKKLLFVLLVFTGCKKTTESVKIEVRDATSNTAVNGAIVEIHRCTISTNPLCGLIPYRTNTTGNDGKCSFTKDEYDQTMQMRVSKANYWETLLVPKTTLLTIYPEGWIRLRIIRGTSYPPQSKLKISLTNTLTSYTVSTEYNTSADSSVLLRGFGGISNLISWNVYDPSFNIHNSGTWNQQLPRMDTTSAVLNY